MADGACCGCPARQSEWLDRLTARIRADMAAEEKMYSQWFDRGWDAAMQYIQSARATEAKP